jgi:hypothetical protein
VTISGFLQNPGDDVLPLVHEHVKIAIGIRNRYFVLFNYIIDGRSNRRMLSLSHAGVADGIPLSEQTLRETPGAPLADAEIPTDATIVAFARYTTVPATSHSRQQMTVSYPIRTRLLDLPNAEFGSNGTLRSSKLRVNDLFTDMPAVC